MQPDGEALLCVLRALCEKQRSGGGGKFERPRHAEASRGRSHWL